jgi:tRNA 5-methylaminomethyl-2-thiouridine biosynthesis bifunctional protein
MLRRATCRLAPKLNAEQSTRSTPIAHCVIIGAGIAGACTAASLARRGWLVTVLDAGYAPASGASGLPVGLYAPYISADNNFTSQITDIGVIYTQRLAKRLLIEGADWRPSGLMTRKYGGADLWHGNAGWIKPAALVNACLFQAHITWRGDCEVKSLVRDEGLWSLLGNDGQVLIQADMVVVAASNQSADLLNGVPAATKLNLQAVRGQVTFGDLKDDPEGDASAKASTHKASTYPINGSGSYIETDSQWLIGATYDRDNLSLDATVRDQVANFERLENLVPDIAAELKPAFERGLVNNWVGTRCSTTDRLPVVGEITQGLWVCTAMASRGLTFAPLCAELLAAQLHDEEPPLNPRLVKALSVQRYMRK